MQTQITIEIDAYNEYRVPSVDDTEPCAYYTDCKTDAIATAKTIHGADVKIKFKRVVEHGDAFGES